MLWRRCGQALLQVLCEHDMRLSGSFRVSGQLRIGGASPTRFLRSVPYSVPVPQTESVPNPELICADAQALYDGHAWSKEVRNLSAGEQMVPADGVKAQSAQERGDAAAEQPEQEAAPAQPGTHGEGMESGNVLDSDVGAAVGASHDDRGEKLANAVELAGADGHAEPGADAPADAPSNVAMAGGNSREPESANGADRSVPDGGEAMPDAPAASHPAGGDREDRGEMAAAAVGNDANMEDMAEVAESEQDMLPRKRQKRALKSKV